MPLTARVLSGRLDQGWVLTPERYDPRRSTGEAGAPLGTLATLGKATSVAKLDPAGRYLVLDTGDATEGTLRPRSGPVPADEVNSSKKRVQAGDVLISRLRPYLRQVAVVDRGLTEAADVLVSTEFYVLRARESGRSLAFLVPFLLSAPVQDALAASQEGGHHPRFNRETLLSLPVPDRWLADRAETSEAVEQAVGAIRSAWAVLAALSSEEPVD